MPRQHHADGIVELTEWESCCGTNSTQLEAEYPDCVRWKGVKLTKEYETDIAD